MLFIVKHQNYLSQNLPEIQLVFISMIVLWYLTGKVELNQSQKRLELKQLINMISVILNVYKRPDMLEKQIQAIMNQSIQ